MVESSSKMTAQPLSEQEEGKNAHLHMCNVAMII